MLWIRCTKVPPCGSVPQRNVVIAFENILRTFLSIAYLLSTPKKKENRKNVSNRSFKNIIVTIRRNVLKIQMT